MADEPTETAGGGAEVFEGILPLMVLAKASEQVRAHGSRLTVQEYGQEV